MEEDGMVAICTVELNTWPILTGFPLERGMYSLSTSVTARG